MKPNYKFKVPIFYDSQVLVFFDKKKFMSWLDKETTHPSSKVEYVGGYSMWNTLKDETHFAVYTPPHCIPTIYHESLHIAWYILDNHGVTVDAGNHEALTYMQGFVAKRIIKAAEKYNKEDQDGTTIKE